jgi:hypothetical protein
VKSERQSGPAPSERLFPAHQVAWDLYLNRVKFCRVPKTYLEHVARVCSSALQSNVVLHVLFSTVGAPDNRAGEKPEWCEVAMSKLAKTYGATINGVAGAIAKVVDAGILEARTKGRGKEYRVLFDNWTAALKPIDLDGPEEPEIGGDEEHAPDDEELAAATQQAGKPFVLARGKRSSPIALGASVEKTQLVNDCQASISVRQEIVGGVLRVTISDAASAQEGGRAAKDLTSQVGISGKPIDGEVPTQLVRFGPQLVDTTTPVDQLNLELTELLKAKLQKKLQSPPPPSMVRAAAARLLAADLGVNEFGETLAVKAPRFQTWGFLGSVVQDCINTHQGMPRPAAAADDGYAQRQREHEYAEFRRDEARRIVEEMAESARQARLRQAELQLQGEARWQRLTAAARQHEIRQLVIAEHATSPDIPSIDSAAFAEWLERRDQQIEQLMNEEAHRA